MWGVHEFRVGVSLVFVGARYCDSVDDVCAGPWGAVGVEGATHRGIAREYPVVKGKACGDDFNLATVIGGDVGQACVPE